MIVKKKKSLSIRGPGRHDTFQTFTVYFLRMVVNTPSQTNIFFAMTLILQDDNHTAGAWEKGIEMFYFFLRLVTLGLQHDQSV